MLNGIRSQSDGFAEYKFTESKAKEQVVEKLELILQECLPVTEVFFPIQNYYSIDLENLNAETKIVCKMIRNLYGAILQQQDEVYHDVIPDHSLPLPIYLQNFRFRDKSVGVASAQGRRPYMEDFYLVEVIRVKTENYSAKGEIYAVFDGHGGKAMAQFLKKNLTKHLVPLIESHNPSHLSVEGVYTALQECCQELDHSFFARQSVFDKDLSGSTASILLILNKVVYCVNVGDSRIILMDKEKTVLLTEDPKPLIERHYKKVIKLGGKISQDYIPSRSVKGHLDDVRVNGRLNMTRAFGNCALNSLSKMRGITVKPLITFFPLRIIERGHIIIASDGVFEGGQTVNKLAESISRLPIEKKSSDEIATHIVRQALGRSYDNITAIVIPVIRRS